VPLVKKNSFATGLGTIGLLAMLGLNAWLLAQLIWVVFTPAGPYGKPEMGGQSVPLAQLTSADPFFRQAPADAAGNVTALALKLFGTRIDEATGQSSAIIATPDGLQSSFVVGGVIMPGVKLASVTREGVTLDHDGRVEKLFLDQSVPAPVAAPSSPPPPAMQSAAPVMPPPPAPPPPPAMPMPAPPVGAQP
jgi:general secretion pathway protein C